MYRFPDQSRGAALRGSFDAESGIERLAVLYQQFFERKLGRLDRALRATRASH